MAKAKILIGTDFSQHSDLALKVGFQWAKLLGGEAHVRHIHSASRSSEGAGLFGTNMEDQISEIVEAARDVLEEKLEDQVLKCGGSKVDVKNAHVLYGKKNDTLNKEAKNLNAKMLILGAQGHTGIGETLLGGTAERAIRTIKAPILIVKDERAAKPKNIFWSTDLVGSLNDFTQEWVGILASSFESEVTIGHSCPPEFEGHEDQTYDKVMEKTSEEKSEKLKPLVNRLQRQGVKAESLIIPSGTNKTEKVLADKIKDRDPDLVIMGTRSKKGVERLILGSVAEYLSHRLPQSFFIIKDPD